MVRRWREGLEREAERRSLPSLEIDTLYFGGGTPSLLLPDELHAILDLLSGRFLLAAREVTLEANPDVRDAGIVRGWKDAGVTRLSIGVQAFDDQVLGTLGRGYSAAQALTFCRVALDVGFETVGIDLMTGVPGETRAAAGKTLAEALWLGPGHVSLYILENVEGLPFEDTLSRFPVDEEVTVESYGTFRAGLEAAGLRQYEISNFARPGKECRHNLKYWRYEPFLGLGPSACSRVGARRWCNKRNLEDWSDALLRNDALEEETVELGPEAQAMEALVFGLRLVEGVDLAGLRARFGVDLAPKLENSLAQLGADGLVIRDGTRLRIPAEKFLISNHILRELI